MTDEKDPPRTVDNALARALVNAQAKAKGIAKDGHNKQGKYNYTTAEAITAEARRVLTSEGLAWSRIRSTLQAPVLSLCDIGNRFYVGDITIAWRLTYSVTGQYIEGESTIPIIAGRGTPHDKASKASETYGTGYILLGLLCLDRDGTNGVDHRGDSEYAAAPAARSPAPQLDVISQAIDVKLDAYEQAFNVTKAEAWEEGLVRSSLPAGMGGDDGPWAPEFTEPQLRAILVALGKALSS